MSAVRRIVTPKPEVSSDQNTSRLVLKTPKELAELIGEDTPLKVSRLDLKRLIGDKFDRTLG